MANDDQGREGLSAGAMAKELGVSPGKVKKALTALELEPDFVKSNCGYYFRERIKEVKKELAGS